MKQLLQCRKKNIKRDALTGKIVNGHKEVIEVENAIEYLKKMGYRVIPENLIATLYTFIALFLTLGMILLLSPFISSQPPSTTISYFPEGYVIIGSNQEFINVNSDYQYNFFVYNQSNGALISNETVTCTFYLANNTGEVIFDSEVDYFEDGHWGIDITSDNFNYIGYYAYGVKCLTEGNDLGGAFTSNFYTEKEYKELFEIDLNSNFAIVLFAIFISIGFIIVFFVKEFNLFGSLFIIISGFILLINNINLIVSMLVITIGIATIFINKE